MARDIRYASSGGVQIAYEAFGSGPRDLVFVHGWVTNLELLCEEPRVARVPERLGSFCRASPGSARPGCFVRRRYRARPHRYGVGR